MTRTAKRKVYRPYSKESKPARKKTMQKYRSEVRRKMSHENYDAIGKFTRTSGW